MSIAALNWAKHVTVGDAMRKSILFVLADYADEQGSCFPSQGTIAEQSEAGERTVRRILAEFEERGILTRKHRGNPDGGRTSDRIYLNLAWLPAGVAGNLTGQIERLPAREPSLTGQAVAGEPEVNHHVEPRRHTSETYSNGRREDWRDARAPTVGRNLTERDQGYGEDGYSKADPASVKESLAELHDQLGPRRKS